VADDADGFPFIDEALDELDCVFIHPEEVRIGDPAWEDERVVVGNVGVRDEPVDREPVCLVEVVEPLDLSLLDREELRLGSGVPDRLPGLLQLHLLDPVGGEERNLLSL
jgi:hypothetical protein